MAQLALGFAGAAVGSFFGPIGASIGWSLGSALGGALFGPKAPDGPRLSDLKLQSSQYGQMIPRVWGRERLAGVVIDQTDLIEHSHSSSGKGQSGPTTFTYTASFAIAICEGPIIGVRRIWADGRIIYDTTGATSVDNSKVPLTVYLGTETQLPDPTFEAIHGVGNVPGYRGTTYVVLTDWDLADFFNRPPNLEFEVYTHAGSIPWQVCTYEGGSPAVSGATYEGGQLTIGHYEAPNYVEDVFLLDGTQVSSTTTAMDALPFNGSSPNSYLGSQNIGAPILCASHAGSPTEFDDAWYYKPTPTLPFTPERATDGMSTWIVGYDIAGLYQDGWVYTVQDAVGGGRFIARWPAPEGQVVGFYDLSYAVAHTASDIWFGSSDNGRVYVQFVDAAADDDVRLIELSDELELLRQWTVADMPVMTDAGGYFVVYNGMLVVTKGNGLIQQRVVLYDLESLSAVSAELGSLNIGGDAPGGIARFSNGLCVVSNGVVSLDPPITKVLLSEIVGDLCDDGGLDATQRDVSELVDEITGFKLTRQGSLRTAIETLQPGYQFDALERDVLVAFPKRGKEPVVIIPEDDLAAVEAGLEQPTPREYTHTNDDELPRQITVVYEEEDADYQPGSQYEQRRVGNAQSDISIELPVAMDAKTARRIAESNLLQAHVERDTFAMATSRKYLPYEPSDVAIVIDRAVRLGEKDHAPSGVVTWKGVASLQSIYVGTAKASSGEGFQQPVARSTQPTDLLLLDIPLPTDTDSAGLYLAMSGTTDSSWRGATLYKSSDDGASYAAIATVTTPSVMGRTSNALGDFAGGDIFDEGNTVTVVIGNGGGALSSSTELGVLNGANLAALGEDGRWELLRYKNATLTAPNTYVLSGLLRGRRGTEWALPSHATGDRFVLLSGVTTIDAPTGEFFNERLYKAVSVGQALSDAPAHEFTNFGNALLPYSPALVAGAPINPFDGTVQINCTRRTRLGGAWSDLVDVPLSESSEQYLWLIWDDTFTMAARQVLTTLPTLTYTAAQQVTDFGEIQQTIFATVSQIGAWRAGEAQKVIVPGLGSSVDPPLDPLPRYTLIPPGSLTGCTLPTQATALDFDTSPQQVINAAANASNTWLVSFTTSAGAVAGPIRFTASAYTGAAIHRRMVLAVTPCGDPLQPGAIAEGDVANIVAYMQDNPWPGYYPTLLPSTTYYLSIDNDDTGAVALHFVKA